MSNLVISKMLAMAMSKTAWIQSSIKDFWERKIGNFLCLRELDWNKSISHRMVHSSNEVRIRCLTSSISQLGFGTQIPPENWNFKNLFRPEAIDLSFCGAYNGAESVVADTTVDKIVSFHYHDQEGSSIF